MLLFVADVCSRYDQSGCELPFYGQVPGIGGGNTHRIIGVQWENLGRDAIRQQMISRRT